MKKLLSLFAIAAAVLSAWSCDDDDDVQELTSLEAPTGLSITRKTTSLLLTWNEVENATSYTVEYKLATASDYTVKGSTAYTVYSLNDLSSGTTYDIRIKATAGSVESAYLTDQATTTSLVEDEEEEAESTADVSLLYTSSSTLTFTWTGTEWDDADTDKTLTSRIQLYSDEDCTDLIVAWTFEGNQVATLSGTTTDLYDYSDYPAFIFSGLSAGTTYYFMVTVTDSDGNEMDSGVISATTDSFTTTEIGSAASASAGDVILAEDFGELTIGGDYVYTHRAPGFSSTVRNTLTSQPFPTGEQPDEYVPVVSSNEVGFFNTMAASVASTRLDTWGVVNEDGNTNKGYLCERPGYIKLGASSYRGLITTPELSSLSGLATVQVSFKAAAYVNGTTPDDHPAAVFTVSGSSIDSYHTVSGTTTQVETFTLEDSGEWGSYTSTISNVTPLMRLALGTADRSTTGTTAGSDQSRCFVDDIVVTLVSYGGTATATTPADLVLTPGSTSIVASWTGSSDAEAYVVEYKKSDDSDYSVVSFDGVAYTTETSATISGLSSMTTYDVRVKAGPYIESDYVSGSATTTLEIPSSIDSADDLELFLNYGSGADGSYALACDIDMSGVTLSAGVSDFAGTFDGGGYSIKNLSSTVPLFETTASSAVVKNIVLDASCSFTASNYVFGPIVSENYGTISGCTNNAPVSYTYDTSLSVASFIGGIAGASFGAVSDCTNNGAVTQSSDGVIRGGAAGIVAYMGAAISGCTNYGAITHSGTRTGSKVSAYSSAVKLPCCMGGVVAYGEDGFSMSSCNNYGTVNFTHTAIDGTTATIERHMIGGVAGNPVGSVESCNNYGAVNVSAKSSTGAAFSSYGYIICAGGISGGDYISSSQNETPLTSCNNYGDVTIDFDSTASNSAIGGIVGWAGYENTAQTVQITDCTNSGTVTISGYGKGRIGGVTGGTTNLIRCKNTGDVVIESINSGSYVGSLIGYHTYGHSLTDCTTEGSVTTKCKVTALGGLIGSNGDKDGSFGSGCSVNCTIADESGDMTATTTGMVVGRINGYTGVVTIGTSDSPVTVAGTILGTTLTSSNYSNYLVGTTNYTTSVHTIYAEYGGE